jgi:hypothetical protein
MLVPPFYLRALRRGKPNYNRNGADNAQRTFEEFHAAPII